MANNFDPETGQPLKPVDVKRTVYDKDSGKAHICEPVDVAELIASGQYVDDKDKVGKKKKKPEQVEKPVAEMNKKEIMKKLKSLEIDFDKKADTEDLRALIPEQE